MAKRRTNPDSTVGSKRLAEPIDLTDGLVAKDPWDIPPEESWRFGEWISPIASSSPYAVMIDPTGRRRHIPTALVPDALEAGATLVNYSPGPYALTIVDIANAYRDALRLVPECPTEATQFNYRELDVYWVYAKWRSIRNYLQAQASSELTMEFQEFGSEYSPAKGVTLAQGKPS